jgi:hypothetical protein
VQYLDGLLAGEKQHQDDDNSTYEAFSDFADPSGYGTKFIMALYDV